VQRTVVPLPSGLSERLDALAVEWGADREAVLLALWATLLGARAPDGKPPHCRTLRELVSRQRRALTADQSAAPDGEHAGVELSVVWRESGPVATLVHDPSCVSPDEAALVAEQFGRLAARACAGTTDLRELVGCAQGPQRELLLAACRGPAPSAPFASLAARLSRWASETPDAPALSAQGRALTYRELEAATDRIADALGGRGWPRGSAVVIATADRLDALLAIVGATKAGLTYVPIDAADPPARRRAAIAQIAARALLVSRPGEGDADAIDDGLAALVIGELAQAAGGTGQPLSRPPGPAGEEPAYVIFTSGSTGGPKAVAITHAGIANYIGWAIAAYELGPGDEVVCHTELSVDLTVTSTLVPLAAGAHVRLVDGIDGLIEDVVRPPGAAVPALLKLTPSHLRALLSRIGRVPRRLARTLVVGGESLHVDDVVPCARGGSVVVNEYGPTETVVGCTAHRVQPSSPLDRGPRVPVGRPIAGAAVYVLNDRLELVEPGITGEVYIGGAAGQAGAYVGAADATATRFVPDPLASTPGQRMYRSGDLGRLRADGSLELLGRRDGELKVKGYRVHPGEIEARLAMHRELAGCAVAVTGGELVAYVALAAPEREAALPTRLELQQFLRQALPHYMIPVRFLIVDRLPFTASGKLDRRRLPSPEQAEQLPDIPYAPPRGPDEELLAAIWGKALGRSRVGRDDNFFGLGGDSIRAIQVVAEAKKHGFDLTVKALFESPTVAQLAPAGRAALRARSAAHPAYRPFDLLDDADRRRLPADVEDAYPVSYLQAGMIFSSEYFDASAIYHDVASYHLVAPFEPERLRRSLEAAMARHAALRTCFDLASYGVPLQLVRRRCAVDLTIDDLSSQPEHEQGEAIAAWMERERRRRFDWRRPPLIRFHAHKRNAGTFQFSLSFHHAIMDGWSEATLLTEVFDAYLGSLRGDLVEPVPPQPVVPLFVRQEQQAVRSPAAQQYWRDLLRGAPPAERAPWRPRPPAARTGERGIVTCRVPIGEQVGARLHDVATRLGVPIKSVLHAAHMAALSVAQKSSDVVTCMVASGRPEESGAERAIGLFLNSVPVRVQLERDGTWPELIARCFAAERAMLPHRQFPYAEIKRQLGGRAPAESLFYFTHYHVFQALGAYPEMGVLDDRYYEETTFALVANFWVHPFDGRISLGLTADRTRLDQAALDALSTLYRAALEAIALGDEAWLRSLTGDAGAAAARDSGAVTDWGGESFLADEILAGARAAPDRTAICCGDERLTYGALAARVEAAARGLALRELGAEAAVLIVLPRSIDLVVAILAALRAGATAAPLHPGGPPDRLAAVMALARPALVIGDGHTALSALEASGASRGEPIDGPADGASAAYLLFTSGSSGQPKGVINTHAGLRNRIWWMRQAYAVGPTDAILHKTPITFDVALWEVLLPLLAGARLVIAEPDRHADAPYLAALMAGHAVTIAHFVPSMLREMIRSGGAPALTLRQLVCSGERLDADDVRGARACFPRARISNLYGPTEAAIDVTAWDCPDAGDLATVPIGRPIANLAVHVLDDRLRPVGPGEEGEIFLAGVGLARGYLQSGATAAAFWPDPLGHAPGSRMYRTGDRGFWNTEGELEFVGRRDGQIKLRGYRIELGEVEQALRAQPGVADAAVLVQRRQEVDRLTAYVITQPPFRSDEVRASLATRLPDYMIPTHIVPVEAFPRTSSGKIDRARLAGKEQARTPGPPPRGPLEELVAQSWREVLGAAEVARSDHFFELGGDSLTATRVVALLRERLDREIPLRALFAAPVLADFATRVEAVQPTAASSTAAVRAAGTEGCWPATIMQEHLWAFEQFHPGSAAYHLPGAFRVDGPLDACALEAALNVVMSRHSALRTQFRTRRGHLQQEVLPALAIGLCTVDLSGLGSERAEALAAELAYGDVTRPFDPARAPLVRATCFRTGDRRSLLAITCHHLVTDGWSLALLAREVGLLYRAAVEGHEPPDLAPVLSYLEAVAPPPGAMDAPAAAVPAAARRTSAPSSVESRTITWSIAPALTARVAASCRALGITPFAAFVGAYAIALGASARDDTVVITTDLAGRRGRAAEGVIGLFAFQVEVGVPLGPPSLGAPVTDFLRAVHERCVDSQTGGAPAATPSDRLSAKLVLQNYEQPEWRLAGAVLREVEIDRRAAKVDLLVTLQPAAGGYRAWLEHRAQIGAEAAGGLVARIEAALETLGAAQGTLGEACAAVDRRCGPFSPEVRG
jgi:amino acid adenylation domain-containing protein